MKNLISTILDFIYKKKCYFCSNSAENVEMCSKCYGLMDFLPRRPNREIDGVKIYCAAAYEKTIQKLIRGVKYHNKKSLAYYQAKFMYEYWKTVPHQTYSYQVIPVPLYKAREKARKYNHMVLVAKEFCKLSGYKLNLDVVKRVKNTKPQYKLTRQERLKNLENAFKIDKTKLIHEKIMLIDDICTTGATFESIIKEFKKANVNAIVGFTTATPIGQTGDSDDSNSLF
jgi:ComF family protein